MSDSPYKKMHVVINPASGKNEPILNVLNDVFYQYDDFDCSVSITKWINGGGSIKRRMDPFGLFRL